MGTCEPPNPPARLPARVRSGVGAGSRLALAVALAAAAALAAAQPLDDDTARHAPSGRFGTLPTPHTAHGLRNLVVNPADLGQHGYTLHHQESTGILYTCRAGFLDLDHVRDAADWTAYLRQRFLDAITHDRDGVAFSGEDRDVRFHVRLKPMAPEDQAAWAGPVATELARRYAFLLLTWHEVMTWFGYRKVFLFPEKVSAFSYEDTVSHLVGVGVGGAAVDDPLPWDAAVDHALGERLQALGAVPQDGTWAAFDKVAGRWFDPDSGWPVNAFVKRRDLDLGLDGQPVVPWTAPGVPGCDGTTAARLVPDHLDALAGGRFAGIDTARLEPGPDWLWAHYFPKGRPLEDGLPVTRLDPRRDVAPVMAEIRREVRAELGPDADQP